MSNNDQQPPSNPPFDPSPTVPFGQPGQAPTPDPKSASPWQPGYSAPQPQGQPYPGSAPSAPGADVPPAQPYGSQPYPGQPLPGQAGPNQAGPGQPFPGQPYAGQPNPGQPYAPSPAAPVPPSGSSGNKKLIWILAGSVAAVLVIAMIVVFAVVRLNAGNRGGTTGTGGGEVKASSAEAAVQGYLEALAAGDAGTALGYADSAPADTSLLTNEVLAASNATAPITDIKVTKPASDYSPTPATYVLGDQPVTTEFYTTKVGGAWKLRTVTREVSLRGMNGVSLTLNGAAVSSDSATLFPGAYTLAATNPYYTVAGGSFSVLSPEDYTSPNFELALSPTGLTTVRNAAQAKLASCVKQTSLAPKGCGFAIRSAGSGATKAKWQISSGKNAMRSANFRLDYTDPTQAKAYTSVSLKVKGYNKAGKYVGYGNGYISSALADLSGKTVTITFD